MITDYAQVRVAGWKTLRPCPKQEMGPLKDPAYLVQVGWEDRKEVAVNLDNLDFSFFPAVIRLMSGRLATVMTLNRS